MKEIIKVGPFPWKGTSLHTNLTIKHNKKTVTIRWDPGTVDYHGEFDRGFSDQAHELSEKLLALLEPLLRDSFKVYGVRHGCYGFSFRWGKIMLHKDQLPTFMAQFKPMWESSIAKIVAEAHEVTK